MHIPSIDANILFNPAHARYKEALAQVSSAATETGFMTVYNLGISRAQVEDLLTMYHRFFQLPDSVKSHVDMAVTNSNRGWGQSGAEQVSADANPDFKQVFDCGPELDESDPLRKHTYYAPNLWPDEPQGFRDAIVNYYQLSTRVAFKILSAIALSLGEPANYFAAAFDKPMALLRGNYYPVRPGNSTSSDFGIAPHTDYGCLTLLATDGTPGLEVKTHDDEWIAVCVPPGEFVINFGEMLEFWTGGRVVATPHRVIGSQNERLSAPLFFNPRYDVNVAPAGADYKLLAGEHLTRRYDETYLHRQTDYKKSGV